MKRGLFNLYLITISLLILTIASCKTKDPEPSNVKVFTDLVIDPSFTFKNNKLITADFTVVPFLRAEARHVITIYQNHPSSGGRILNKGITNNNYKYNVEFKVPDRLDSIYVENRNSDGLFEIVGIPLTGNNINYSFSTKDLLYGNKSVEKTTVVDPGCGSGCEETISGTYTNLQLDKLDYCVDAGTSLTVTNLTMKRNATLVICGNVTITQISTSDNTTGKIYVSENGVLNIPGHLNINSKIEFYNFGVMNISGNVTTQTNRKFYNYGTMAIAGVINNNTKKFNNEGTLNLAGNYNGNSGSKLTNYGTFNVSGSMNINSNSVIRNYCHIDITGNLINNYKLWNHSYFNVGQTYTINGSAFSYMQKGSLLQTTNLTVNGRISGQSNKYGKVMVSGTTIINSSGRVQGRLDLCDENGIEVDDGFIANNVVFCEILIPEDECNPGSEGGSGDQDSDGDGVVDTEDDYPYDAERAFDNYYPNETDFASIAFEDLWPGLGDYDFNDLVVDFNYKIVTNASNLIVDIIAQTNVKAAGAGLNNGFGLSIPIESSRCASATGFVNVMGTIDLNANGYENGHTDNTVVIFYDAINTIYGSAIFNTVPGGAIVETDTITVTIYFDDPQIGLGQEPYNPFIYVDQERGKEVHMIDHEPTTLANNEYFGTAEDDSNPQGGKYYLTKTYLPWAVETPNSFEYPIEKVDILNAYLKFAEWAESSGAVYNDWYLDEPGYRNNDKIYQKPD